LLLKEHWSELNYSSLAHVKVKQQPYKWKSPPTCNLHQAETIVQQPQHLSASVSLHNISLLSHFTNCTTFSVSNGHIGEEQLPEPCTGFKSPTSTAQKKGQCAGAAAPQQGQWTHQSFFKTRGASHQWWWHRLSWPHITSWGTSLWCPSWCSCLCSRNVSLISSRHGFWWIWVVLMCGSWQHFNWGGLV